MIKEKLNIYGVIPILIMLIGIILYWLRVDGNALILSSGFLAIGIFFFAREIRKKSSNSLPYKITLITIPLVTVVLSLQNLITSETNFGALAITQTMYSLLVGRYNPVSTFKKI